MGREFRQGFFDFLPVLAALMPIGLLLGTLAASKGLSPLEIGLMSILVFAGSSQFVALELWRDPAPWALVGAAAFIVNLRFVLMNASLARSLAHVPPGLRALIGWYVADENWAFAERRAQSQRLTAAYCFGITFPMVTLWTVCTVVGAIAGKAFGRPEAFGFDFAFSAVFIAIIAGFVKTRGTGLVLASSALASALAKLYVPGAWYIIIGGLAGIGIAALMWQEEQS